MYEYIINFFKKMGFYQKDYFKSIEKNVTIINKDYKDIKEFVGFYPDCFKLVLPKIKTYHDILVWIHEYSHALFPDDSSEIFPNIMEAYFINMYISDKKIIDSLLEQTQMEINTSTDNNHRLAKKIKLNTIISR